MTSNDRQDQINGIFLLIWSSVQVAEIFQYKGQK